MKRIEEVKYVAVWIILWLWMIWFSSYAAVTWGGTIWSLFVEITGNYYLDWDNIQNETVDSSEIENETIETWDIKNSTILWEDIMDWEISQNKLDNTLSNKIDQIAINTTNISTNTTNISTNTTDISTLVIPTTVAELTDSSDYTLNSLLSAVALSWDYIDLINLPSLEEIRWALWWTLTFIREDSTIYNWSMLGQILFDWTDGAISTDDASVAIIASASESHSNFDKWWDLSFWTKPTNTDYDQPALKRMEINDNWNVYINEKLYVWGSKVADNFNVTFKVRPEDLLDNGDDYTYLDWWETTYSKVSEKSSLTINFFSYKWWNCDLWTSDSDEQWVQNFDLLNTSIIPELWTWLWSSRNTVKSLFTEICDDDDGCMIRYIPIRDYNTATSWWIWNIFSHLTKWYRDDIWSFYSLRTSFDSFTHLAISDLNPAWANSWYTSDGLWHDMFWLVNQRWPYTGAATSNSLYLHIRWSYEICYDWYITFVD